MKKNKMICPVCDEGHLTPRLYSDHFKHNTGSVFVEGLEYCGCDLCGADPVLADQIKRNHLKIADAKRKADGLFTGDEIRTIRAMLGLTQQAAAQLIGGGTNAFSKYERGDVLQSVGMDRLLTAVAVFPELLHIFELGSPFESKNFSCTNKYEFANAKSVKIPKALVKTKKIKGISEKWTDYNGRAA